jgi:ferredoxin
MGRGLGNGRGMGWRQGRGRGGGMGQGRGRGGGMGGGRGGGMGQGHGRGWGMRAETRCLPGTAPVVPAALHDRAVSRSKPVESVRRLTAVVDQESCTGCGICIDACRRQALSLDGIAAVDPERCTGCGACIAECPNEALSLSRQTSPAGGGISG